MTDTIQTRIREYLAADNDECHRKLLREAVDRIDVLESKPIYSGGVELPPYLSPVEAWSKL